MLIIWGVRVFFHTAGQGVFHCQRCRSGRRYRRRSGRRFFTLFLVPVIPLAKVGEHVQCAACRTRFHPDVLTLPRPSQQGASAGLPAPRDGFAGRCGAGDGSGSTRARAGSFESTGAGAGDGTGQHHGARSGSCDGTGATGPQAPARHVAGHGVIVKFDNLYRDAVRTAAS